MFHVTGGFMSFKIAGQRGEDPGAAQIVEHSSHGGLLATILSAFALVISGLSYYESSLKTADLTVYVPPMIHYARDGSADVFNVPVTIANDGAKNGTVLTMELEVENLRPDAETKLRRFHSAFLGDWPKDDKTPNRSFAPLSIPGHGTFTETVRFYPMDDSNNFVVDDKGDYRFTLKLAVAKSASALDALGQSEPAALVFELNLPYLAVQHLAFRNGTQAMFSKTWKPASSADAGAAEPATGAAPADEARHPSDAKPPQAAPAPEQTAPQKIEIIPEKPAPPPPATPKAAAPKPQQR